MHYLRTLAGELGVGSIVRLVAGPDDFTMHSLVSCADVCVNLRHLSTETSSLSLIEQMHFGY